MAKQLTRLPNDKIICGICSGIAQYLGWDKTVVRIIMVLIFIFTGFFPITLLYIIAYFIMPVDPSSNVIK
ncbi:MAG: PspC domain-containing protein [Elusimicrobia bacterium]|nr:PspC domain-containing protein [Elusimicrobiota bacterium]